MQDDKNKVDIVLLLRKVASSLKLGMHQDSPAVADGLNDAADALEGRERDLSLAAGELCLEMPCPGTDLARSMAANAIMRRERDSALAGLAEAEALIDRLDKAHERAARRDIDKAVELDRLQDIIRQQTEVLAWYADEAQWTDNVKRWGAGQGESSFAVAPAKLDGGEKARWFLATASMKPKG